LADLSDVEIALVTAVSACIYPAGISEPSITGTPVRIYRGWPQPGPLAADLAQSVANISIYAVPHATHNTTRWGPVTNYTKGVITLTVRTSGNSVTFGGVGGAGQVAGVLVNNQPFAYSANAGDTPALIAAVLAQNIRLVTGCWLSGDTLTVPGVSSVIARVVANGIAATEWARQVQGFRIAAWCPSPAARDLLCSAIGGVFSAMSFLTLGDGSAGRLRYRSTQCFDDDQDAQQYRRDLIYEVEYGTSLVEAAPAMLFGDLVWAGAGTYC